MTAVQLSARCEELGLPIHRTTLSKIEKGRSSFDLAELIILARALNVPPLELIYPDLPDGMTEVWPSTDARSIDAAQWFTGERLLATDDETGHATPVEMDGAAFPRIEVARMISNAAQRLSDQQLRVSLLREAGRGADDDAVELAIIRAEKYSRDLASFLRMVVTVEGYNVNPDNYSAEVMADVNTPIFSDETARILAERIEAKRTEHGASDGQG